jgi:hypothetical protein
LPVLWAAALLALLAAARATQLTDGLFALADPFFEPRAFSSSPAYVVAASILASALAGAGLGLIGRRLMGRALVRSLLLAVFSLPALYVLIALALTILWIPQTAKDGFTAALLTPVGSLPYAAYGMVLAAPIAAPPAILAALMLEGWTRPEDRGQGGLANPRLRRWTMHLLVAATAAFTTFAALRWPRA